MQNDPSLDLVDFECGDKNNGDLQRLSFLKKRRKLYQHGEKEIKLLRLRDDIKTRSLLTLWILNVLLQTNSLGLRDYYRLLIQLLYLFVGGL